MSDTFNLTLLIPLILIFIIASIIFSKVFLSKNSKSSARGIYWGLVSGFPVLLFIVPMMISLNNFIASAEAEVIYLLLGFSLLALLGGFIGKLFERNN